MLDMQFNLNTGKVTHATKSFYHKASLDEIMKIYDDSADKKVKTDMVDLKKILKFIEELRFMSRLENLQFVDKLDLAKSFKLKRLTAG